MTMNLCACTYIPYFVGIMTISCMIARVHNIVGEGGREEVSNQQCMSQKHLDK